MTMPSQATTTVTRPSSARRTPPRAADATRLPQNTLARNDARNGRSAPRNRSPVHAQGEPEHVRNANAHDTDETHRRRYTHEKFRPEQIARALRQLKGGHRGSGACAGLRAQYRASVFGSVP
jgi:hypothetical protein